MSALGCTLQISRNSLPPSKPGLRVRPVHLVTSYRTYLAPTARPTSRKRSEGVLANTVSPVTQAEAASLIVCQKRLAVTGYPAPLTASTTTLFAAAISTTTSFLSKRRRKMESTDFDARYLKMEDRANTARSGKGAGGRRGGRGGKGGNGRPQNRNVLVSKALSRLLRHQADTVGIKLDAGGWAPLDRVVSSLVSNPPPPFSPLSFLFSPFFFFLLAGQMEGG